MTDIKELQIDRIKKDLKQKITNSIGVSNIFKDIKVKMPLSHWVTEKIRIEQIIKLINSTQ